MIPKTHRSARYVSAETATSFLTYPGEWDLVFDGLAAVNRGSQAAGVDAVLVNGRGAELRRVKLAEALPPGAKRIALLDGIFAGLQGAAIRIESTQPSSVLLLRGTKVGVRPAVLHQTIPIAIPR